MTSQKFQTEQHVNDAIQAEHARMSAQMTERHHQRVAYTRSLPIDPSLVMPLDVLAQRCTEALDLIRSNTLEQSLTNTMGTSQSAAKHLGMEHTP